ncbi:flagellar protein FliT [bacterium]|nr:flagellar protein FliT [bacterium]
MQDDNQYELLIMQYNQLKNGAMDIAELIENEDYDTAITMIKSREKVLLNCKCMRRYLELNPTQQKEVDSLVDEIRELELKNIKKLEKNMDAVQSELTFSQKSQKIQNAYEKNESAQGSIVNVEE